MTTDWWYARGDHLAFAVSIFHSLPSAEDHTIFDSPEKPQPTAMLDEPGSEARRPSRVRCLHLPFDSVCRRPDLIAGRTSGKPTLVPSAHDPEPVFERDPHGKVAMHPRRIGIDKFPLLAINGRPHVARRSLVRTKPAAREPHLVIQHPFHLGVAWLPSRSRFQDPIDFTCANRQPSCRQKRQQ